MNLKVIYMNNSLLFICFSLLSLNNIYCDSDIPLIEQENATGQIGVKANSGSIQSLDQVGELCKAQTAQPISESECCNNPCLFQGWSIDVGGQYTWMLFTSPCLPNFSGNTGGAHGSITYQKRDSVFAQVRSFWNRGHLQATGRSSNENEIYIDLLAGYCFSSGCERWMITPYLGIGVDFLNDHKSSTPEVTDIKLKYRLNYGVAGLDVRYMFERDWVFGAQVECFPTFEQHLSITGLPGAAWTLKERIGWNARLPIDYRLTDGIWLEIAPYYRYLAIGKSGVLSLPKRDLHEVGGLVTFRFFIY